MTDGQKTRLAEVFGDRFTVAYRALEERRVKKHIFHPSGRVVWIVAGRERDYQILPLANFCSCLDFYFRVIGREKSFCYHLIAQKLAEALDGYLVIDEPDANLTPLMESWRRPVGLKRRLSMAEVENIRKVVVEILIEGRELPIERLLGEVREAGFNVLTARHLANILIADKVKRFKHANGLWTLSQAQ